GKGLIEFDSPYLVPGDTGALQRKIASGDRSFTKILGFVGSSTPGDHTHQRVGFEEICCGTGTHEHHAGPIIHRRGVASSYRTVVLAKNCTETRKRLNMSFRADGFIAFNIADGHDKIVIVAYLPGSVGALMR